MVCGKVVSIVVVCSVAATLAARGGQLGSRNDIKRGIGKSNSSPRDLTGTTEVTMIGPQSTLFGNCVAESNSAFVTFKHLVFPNGGNEYIRYVPSSSAFFDYSAWSRVPGITSFQDCSTYAEDNDAVMFYFDGSDCYTSDEALPAPAPSCDPNEQAAFVQQICPVDISDVTIVLGGIKTYKTTWSLDDPCNLTTSIRLNYYHGASGSETDNALPTVEEDRQYLSSTDNVSVTVTAVSQTLGDLDSGSDTYTPAASPTCQDSFILMESICTFKTDDRKTFVEATGFCDTQHTGAKMFTVGSLDELNDLKTFIGGTLATNSSGNRRFWVNLVKQDNGEWIWGETGYDQGAEQGANGWAAGEPFNLRHDCGTMGAGDGDLESEDCTNDNPTSAYAGPRTACFYVP